MLHGRVSQEPRRHRRSQRVARPCARCGESFTPVHIDGMYCSRACCQAAWRDRRPRPWAVVTWRRDKRAGDIRARWTYHHTAELAQRAAPADAPFTVVNIAKPPSITFPNIEELIRRTRPLIEQHRDTKTWHAP